MKQKSNLKNIVVNAAQLTKKNMAKERKIESKIVLWDAKIEEKSLRRCNATFLIYFMKEVCETHEFV